MKKDLSWLLSDGSWVALKIDFAICSRSVGDIPYTQHTTFCPWLSTVAVFNSPTPVDLSASQ